MGSSVLIYWATDQYYEEEAFSDAQLSSGLLPSSVEHFFYNYILVFNFPIEWLHTASGGTRTIWI